jgi:4-amino-4-deoxy-L-arabinose transferase-like glycosyltransferase
MLIARSTVGSNLDQGERASVPTASRRYREQLPLRLIQISRVPQRRRLAIVAVAVGSVTFLVQGYRLSVAPDVFSDEGIYLGVATNLARGSGLTLNNSVFLWHPPGYMLVASAYIKIAGLAYADPITTLLSVRYLNVFFSAITGALLMLFGRKLHSYKAGLAAAALFLMDPYVQRINRRSMLETLAMLFVLLGLYIFFTRRPRLTAPERLGSGVAFGLAMLTKEPMFLELLGLTAYVLWSRRSQLRDLAWVAVTACVVYLPYPVWVVAIGQGDRYLLYQLFGISRALHSLPGYPPSNASTVPAPRATFSRANLHNLLPQYAMSYLLILLATIFTAFLIFRFRHVLAARYLVVWSVVSFGIGFSLGRVSDQYFYYMIVPSTLVAGYVLASAAEAVQASRASKARSWVSNSSGPAIVVALIFAGFGMMFVYNSYVWAARYGIGSDDAYITTMRYVKNHVPAGETIVSSDDVAYYFLSPTYRVRLDRNAREILARCERYFIMSSKDAWGRYNLTTPQFYDWVVQRSQPLFVQHGHSFWRVGVYARPATPTGEPGCSSAAALVPRAQARPTPAAYRGAGPARREGDIPR